VVEHTAALAREAALQDAQDALAPAIEALASVEAGGRRGHDRRSRARAGPARARLTPLLEPGQALDLWPEQAGELALDRPVPAEAALARVVVVAAAGAAAPGSSCGPEVGSSR